MDGLKIHVTKRFRDLRIIVPCKRDIDENIINVIKSGWSKLRGAFGVMSSSCPLMLKVKFYIIVVQHYTLWMLVLSC